jgi:redox-sensitive bicupin YhaK (pirin superfamily)
VIDLVIEARTRDLGGFEVGRILPFAKRRMVGPFVFLDHMGPASFAPGAGIDVRPHPHIGLTTLTYQFEGEILHQDSLGYRLPIRPGEVNWMTAGRGIVHSERTDRETRLKGANLHGMQAWVALPIEDEETDPAFFHHGQEDLPSFQDTGLSGRLIAGSGFGLTSGVKTHSPMVYAHWELKAGTTAGFPDEYPERAAYVARGEVEIDGRTFHAGQMPVFEPGGSVGITATTEATVMLLGGEPVGPRIVWWNLVSHSQDRIEQAKADWKAGRLPLPPEDNAEYIPLPEDPPPPPEPAS